MDTSQVLLSQNFSNGRGVTLCESVGAHQIVMLTSKRLKGLKNAYKRGQVIGTPPPLSYALALHSAQI